MQIQNEHMLADRPLVEKILGGDTRAFAVLIKQTEGLVAQILFKMIDNHFDRQDIVQEVYIKAFQHLSGFKFQSKLSTWIGQIAYNTSINYLRKKSVILVDPKDHEADTGLAGLVAGPDQLLMESETRAALSQAIDRLPPVYKTLVTLYHQEDMSYAEIAEITQLPEGTVKSYLFRARKNLRETLLPTYSREEI